MLRGGNNIAKIDELLTCDDTEKQFNSMMDIVIIMNEAFIRKAKRINPEIEYKAISREELLDAQKHPENYRQLVVRIWGWSAYFVELDKEYQDHVIARQAYTV